MSVTFHSQSPSAPRLLFHYGWVNLVLAALAMVATFPGRTVGLSMINLPLQADLGIGDVFQGSLNFWSVLVGAAFCWPVGRLLDQFGTRVVLTAVIAALGGAVLWMSAVEDADTLFYSLTLTRGLGQGALSLASMALVSKWFQRRLEPAMGIFSVLLAIGFIAMTVALGESVKVHGWRGPWAALGWGLLAGLAPLCFVAVRSRPEDGWSDPREFSTQTNQPALLATGATLREALVSPGFWVVTVAASFFNLVFSGFTFFAEKILQQQGFSHDEFTLVMSILALSGIISNLLAGYLSRRRSQVKLLAVGMALQAAALALFPLIRLTPLLAIFGLVLGGAGGIVTVVFFAVYSRYYGRRHVGQIQGAAQVVTVFASAAGPLLLAWSNEQSEGHLVFFATAAVLSVALAAACWGVKMPEAAAATRPKS